VLKIITVALGDTEYMMYNTQYNKLILPRAKMGIYVRAEFASSSEFKCDSNALLFSLIGREPSEPCEFYTIYPEMAWSLELQKGTHFYSNLHD
jgi:hypothetical protein